MEETNDTNLVFLVCSCLIIFLLARNINSVQFNVHIFLYYLTYMLRNIDAKTDKVIYPISSINIFAACGTGNKIQGKVFEVPQAIKSGWIIKYQIIGFLIFQLIYAFIIFAVYRLTLFRMAYSVSLQL